MLGPPAKAGRERSDSQVNSSSDEGLGQLHVNFFQPVQKLEARVRVEQRVRRIYDRARTPYQRLCATGVLKPEAREALDQLYHSLNPLQLRRQLDAALERLWALATPAPPVPSGIQP